MSEAFEFFQAYPGIVMEGIRMTVGIPRRFDLRVDPDWQRRHEAAGGGLHRPIGRPVPEHLIRKSRPQPPLKIIHVMLRQKGVSGESHLRVAINLNTRRIDTSNTSMALLGVDYHGSAGIGIALFSAPVVLPLLPVLFLVNGVYRVGEQMRGMSRHGANLYDALKDQLDAEMRELLHEALRNNWTQPYDEPAVDDVD